MVALVLFRVALEAAQQLQEGHALHQRLVYGDVGLAHRRKAVKKPLVQLPAPTTPSSASAMFTCVLCLTLLQNDQPMHTSLWLAVKAVRGSDDYSKSATWLQEEGPALAGCFGNAEDGDAEANGRFVVVLEGAIAAAQHDARVRPQPLEVRRVCAVPAHQQHRRHLRACAAPSHPCQVRHRWLPVCCVHTNLFHWMGGSWALIDGQPGTPRPSPAFQYLGNGPPGQACRKFPTLRSQKMYCE